MKRREGWGVSVCVHALGYPLALLGVALVLKFFIGVGRGGSGNK